jgi:hypothetical protein
MRIGVGLGNRNTHIQHQHWLHLDRSKEFDRIMDEFLSLLD